MPFLVHFVVLLAIQGLGMPRADRPPEPPIAKALEAAPIDGGRRAQIVRALGARDYQRAEELIVAETQKNHASAAALIPILGRVLFIHGRYTECAVVLVKADSAGILDNESRFTLAMAYVVTKRTAGAREQLDKLAGLEPRNATYPYWQGRLDYDGGFYKEAVEHFRRALELDPNFMRAYDNLGLALEGVGDLERAVESYQKAIRLNRDGGTRSPWPAANLGALWVKMGKYEDAEPLLREALGYDANCAPAHCKLGVLFEKQGKLQDAIRELERAAALDTGYAEAHYALGRVYQAAGHKDKARQEQEIFEKLKAQTAAN